MKHLVKFAPMALLLFSNQAHASAQNGHITSTYIEAGGRFLFYMDGTRSPAPPSCAYGDGRWELSVDPTSAAGQLQVSALMTAQATHQPVYVSGTNDCSTTDSERVGWFKTNP